MAILNEILINQYKDMLGADVFQQTIDLYQQQSVEYLNKLDQAISNADYQQWQDSCHVLKSASGNIGLQQVFEFVSEQEYSKKEFTELADNLRKLRELNELGLATIKNG